MYLPEDAAMLSSFINMKLRDEGATLSELADSYDFDENTVRTKLEKAGYRYDEENRRFR